MITLRAAREADVPALIELARRSWLSGFAGSAPPALVRDRLAREFERDWYPRHWPAMTVAEECGVLLGVVQPEGDEVNGLWVAPEAQGRGVGTTLLRHAEWQIAAAGHARAWLTCSGFNPGAARFYRARGYHQVGTATKDRGEGLVAELLTFERALVPPPEVDPGAAPDQADYVFQIRDGGVGKVDAATGATVGSCPPIATLVVQVLVRGDLIVVREDYVQFPRGVANVYCLDRSLKRVWVAELPSETDAYANPVVDRGEHLECASWEGWTCDLDPRTGRIIRKMFTK
jgi:putative acetyltransferase